MPALLIPVITSALAATALSSTAIAATAFIAANAIVAGAALGLNALLNSGDDVKVASQQYQSRQSMPTLLYGYGTNKLGGSKFAFDTAQGYYVDGLIHSCGPVSSIKKWYLNDDDSKIPADAPYGNGGFGGPVVILPWDGVIRLESHKGTSNQGVAEALVGVLPGVFTNQHQLNGLFNTVMACLPVKQDKFQKYYPNGPPAVYVIADMAPVYDPRDAAQDWNNPSTWKFSENVALALLHYLTATRGTDSVTGQPVAYGFGFPKDAIDLASFIAYANVCDQSVNLKGAGAEKRYRIGGTFDMGKEERRTVLNRILATGDAELYENNLGQISVRGGVWTAPTVTITPEHILGYEYEGGSDKLAAFNRLKISFMDPRNDYQVIEGDPWDDTAAQLASLDGMISQDLTLGMCPSHPQARRLAKIATAKANPKHKLTITTDLYGLMAFGERTITLTLPELNIDTTFLVTGFTQSPDGTCKIGLSSLGPEAYAWNPTLEEGTAPAIASTSRAVTTTPGITNPQLVVDRSVANGVVTSMAITATADAPPASSGGWLGDSTSWTLHGRIRAAGGAWIDMVPKSADVNNVVTYGPVSEGVVYEVQLAYWAPYGGTQAPWGSAGTITAVADATVPSVPTYTSLALLAGGPAVRHTFKQSPSPNAQKLQFLRATGFNKVFADAVQTLSPAYGPNVADTLDDTVPLGRTDYWIRAANGSNINSNPVGPLTVYNSMQAGNKTTAPYDFNNAAWIKVAATTVAPTQNGPDGNTATMLSETAVGSSHYARQSVPITSGQRVQVSFGVKGVGRSRFRLNIYDASGSAASSCNAVFNLSAGTVVASTPNSSMTNIVGTYTQVTADYYILTLSANVASTAADGRFYLLDDTGAASYVGDTTKGALLWGGTIAVVT